MTIPRIRWILMATLVILALVMQIPAVAAKTDSELGAKETQMGKEAAAEVAKANKLSDNAADLKRVREIGDKLAAVANKKEVAALYGVSKITPFQFTFNIIEDKDVNAFCVPGGYIYVYRGLLDFVESDAELAGVLAHEITHAAHHHMVFLLKKQAAMENVMAVALLAMMLGKSSGEDIGNIQLGMQLYSIAKLNGYGQLGERDADSGAIYYMRDAGYNPVGLLTFMERMARRPETVDYGIYRSHPLDADRVKSAKTLLQELNIPINRRDTTKAVKAEVKTEKVNGADVTGVAMSGATIYRPAAVDGKSAEQRAKEIAEDINKALDSKPNMRDVTADPSGGVVLRGKALLMVSEADARLMNDTPENIAKRAADAIRKVVWQEFIDTVH